MLPSRGPTCTRSSRQPPWQAGHHHPASAASSSLWAAPSSPRILHDQCRPHSQPLSSHKRARSPSIGQERQCRTVQRTLGGHPFGERPALPQQTWQAQRHQVPLQEAEGSAKRGAATNWHPENHKNAGSSKQNSVGRAWAGGRLAVVAQRGSDSSSDTRLRVADSRQVAELPKRAEASTGKSDTALVRERPAEVTGQMLQPSIPVSSSGSASREPIESYRVRIVDQDGALHKPSSQTALLSQPTAQPSLQHSREQPGEGRGVVGNAERDMCAMHDIHGNRHEVLDTCKRFAGSTIVTGVGSGVEAAFGSNLGRREAKGAAATALKAHLKPLLEQHIISKEQFKKAAQFGTHLLCDGKEKVVRAALLRALSDVGIHQLSRGF